jgi:hypothetical protein
VCRDRSPSAGFAALRSALAGSLVHPGTTVAVVAVRERHSARARHAECDEGYA